MILTCMMTSITCLVSLHMVSSILSQGIYYHKWKYWMCYILLVCCTFILSYFSNDLFLLSLGIVWILSKIIWNQKMSQTGLAVIFSFFSLMLADILVTIVMISLGVSTSEITDVIRLICSIITSLISLFFFHLFHFKNLYKMVIETCSKKISDYYILIGIVICMFLFYIYHFLFSLVGYLFLLVFSIILIEYFKEKVESKRLLKDYQDLMVRIETNSQLILEKESHLNKYRNQLSLLRQMMEGSEDGIHSYIDQILEEESSPYFDSYIWKEIQKLPKNGLAGLFCFKSYIVF